MRHFSLVKYAQNGDNTATTKRKAVKPNRHTLAIFMPICHKQSTKGVNTHILSLLNAYHGITAYGGLIEPNTIPLAGNKFSRLFAVVETRPPFALTTGLAVSLTKRKGA